MYQFFPNNLTIHNSQFNPDKLKTHHEVNVRNAPPYISMVAASGKQGFSVRVTDLWRLQRRGGG